MYARAAARPLSSEASAASAAMGEDDGARAGTCAATSHAGRTRSSMAPTTNVPVRRGCVAQRVRRECVAAEGSLWLPRGDIVRQKRAMSRAPAHAQRSARPHLPQHSRRGVTNHTLAHNRRRLLFTIYFEEAIGKII